MDLGCRGAWFLFYTIEAVAIYSILNQHPHDQQAAVSPAHGKSWGYLAILHSLQAEFSCLWSLVVRRRLGAWSADVIIPEHMGVIRLCVDLPFVWCMWDLWQV